MSGSTWEGGCREGPASSNQRSAALTATRSRAGCAENDGGAGTFGEAAGEGGRGLSLPVFLPVLCKILLPPLVKAPKRAVVLHNGPMAMQRIERTPGPRGRAGEGMK